MKRMNMNDVMLCILMGWILLLGAYILVSNHFEGQRAVSGLWEEFRHNVEDCDPPGDFDYNGECRVPLDPETNSPLYKDAHSHRSQKAILRERDGKLRMLSFCHVGVWWESKMTGERPVASDSTWYWKCDL